MLIRIPVIVSISLFVFLQGCDGGRHLRVDIDLSKQTTQGAPHKLSEEDYNSTVQLIDDLANKNKLPCQSCDKDNLYRHYGRGEGFKLLSNTNKISGIFSIYLSEFGPLSATPTYKSLHGELLTAITEKYSPRSIIMNPYQCEPPYVRNFLVKLHNRKPWTLWFVNWSIEPEFTKASEIIDKVARKYEVTQVPCYSTSNRPCRTYQGGEFIGVERAVVLQIYGDSYDTSLRGEIIDLSCKESELTKSLYTELVKAMMQYFGEAAVKSSN